MMTWISTNLMFCIALLAFSGGILWLLPGRVRRNRFIGLGAVVAGLALLAWQFGLLSLPAVEQGLAVLLGGGALLAGVLMITSRNPVYGALWFAVVTLCTCGLFVVQEAPFLAAATVIVYAGAIIVTFIFVIMLAQQEGAAAYDQIARRPVGAVLLGVIALGLLLGTIRTPGSIAAKPAADQPGVTTPNALSRPTAEQPLGTMHGLGRSLFGDYLFAVEVAGTLLLVASIGAIVIAPRKGRRIE